MLKERQKVLLFEKERFTPVVDTAVKSHYMQLLNANSYEKGSWALHMLRSKLGDTVFWKGIRNYFAKYNGSNASTNDFRKIMEQTSGQNLQLFFKQWLFTAGHPRLNITWQYDPGKRVINTRIEQLQDMPYEFALVLSVDGQLHTVFVKNKITIVQIPVFAKPVSIIPDPNINLLAEFSVTEN